MRIRLTNYFPWCAALALALTACGTRESEPARRDARRAGRRHRTRRGRARARTCPSGTWTGDLDGMTERRVVRMLVIYSKTSYFLDNAQQRGATYDMGVEFEKWLNRGNKDRSRPIRVVFIPTSRARLMTDLTEGRGDIAAAGLAITPERQQSPVLPRPSPMTSAKSS